MKFNEVELTMVGGTPCLITRNKRDQIKMKRSVTAELHKILPAYDNKVVTIGDDRFMVVVRKMTRIQKVIFERRQLIETENQMRKSTAAFMAIQGHMKTLYNHTSLFPLTMNRM